MADKPFDLEAYRRARRPDWVDYDRIEMALAELRSAASQITARSFEDTGAVDPLAHEMCAFINAIERIAGRPK